MFIIRPELNTNNIEKRESDYNLFKKYCKNFSKIGDKFKSEFRNDKNPSAVIDEYNKKLWYRDFGDPFQEKPYDIYSFLIRKYNLSFIDVLIKINNDFELGLWVINSSNVSSIKKEINSNPVSNKTTNISEIKIKKTLLRNIHFKYWMDYNIPKNNIKKLLSYFNVYPISHFWLINTTNINHKLFVVNGVGFSQDYEFDTIHHVKKRKVYLPKKSGSLFFTNCNDVIQGYNQLPKKGDLLFITSSLKDIIILRCIGYYAIAPSNENSFISEVKLNELHMRFKRIIIMYDNDCNKEKNWGKLYAEKYSKQYDIPYILLPNNEGKDPSDFSKKNGLISLTNTIINMIK